MPTKHATSRKLLGHILSWHRTSGSVDELSVCLCAEKQDINSLEIRSKVDKTRSD